MRGVEGSCWTAACAGGTTTVDTVGAAPDGGCVRRWDVDVVARTVGVGRIANGEVTLRSKWDFACLEEIAARIVAHGLGDRVSGDDSVALGKQQRAEEHAGSLEADGGVREAGYGQRVVVGASVSRCSG